MMPIVKEFNKHHISTPKCLQWLDMISFKCEGDDIPSLQNLTNQREVIVMLFFI